MKAIGYICLGLFAITALISYLTLIETQFMVDRMGAVVRWNPEVGDGIAAPLTVGAVLAAVGAILTKVIGFGAPVIRRDQRGLIAGLRVLPLLLKILLVVSLAYGIACFFMVKTNTVTRIGLGGGGQDEAMGYYVYPEGDQSQRAVRLDRSQYRQEKAAWTRKITSFTMNVYLLTGCFLLSRVWRRDSELVAIADRGVMPGQIDDSMNL